MMRRTVVCVGVMLAGCVSTSPGDWQPYQHQSMMKTCAAICNKSGGVTSYEPLDGACTCRTGRRGE